MIEVKERVVVVGARQTVWEIVSDPAAVASCINGCELGQQRDDGAYDATIGVKFGGIRVRFRTLVHLEVDEPTMTGQLRITGADQQGATRVGGTANFEVQAVDDERSAVEFAGSLDINGKLATLIASGANVVVSRMTREFTECLSTKLALISHPAATTPPMTITSAPAAVATTATVTGPSWTTRLRELWTSLTAHLRSTKGTH